MKKNPTTEMQNKQETVPAHVVVVPTPGMGHLIPLVELANRLVLHHNFRVTFIIPNDGSSMKPHKKLLETLPESASTVFLPPVSFDDMPDIKMEARIILSLTRSLPAFRESFKVMAESTRLVALVADLFGVDTFGVAREFGVPPYIFFTSTAMLLSFIFRVPELDEIFTCEYKDLPEPLQLTGCVAVHGSDLPEPVQDKKDPTYKWVIYLAKTYQSVAGIIVNSFVDLEPGAFKALTETKLGFGIPVYPVGPLVLTGSSDIKGDDDHFECLKWLEQQPSASVLFVSFGSGGTMSQEQLNELAFGLEMSGQRFLWVAKSPHETSSNATYFEVQSINDPFDFLPKEFLARTESKGVGLLVPSWAPQIQVLSHGSTGGFLTHCGWNSALESIVHGVPLIAWPLFAEQKLNAVLLTDDLKVALRVKVNENGLVGREDIAKYVRGLIEGGEGKLLRNNMGKLKDAAAIVLGQDGSSTKSLAEVAQILKNKEKVAN